MIPRPVSSPHFSAAGVAVLQVSAGGNHSLALAKVPLEMSNNVPQSPGPSSLSNSQTFTPISSKSAPSSPATQSRVRSQQLVLSMLESSTDASQSRGRERSFTVEIPSPLPSENNDLESSHKKEKKEKKRSRSKLEDSGSRTSRVSRVALKEFELSP